MAQPHANADVTPEPEILGEDESLAEDRRLRVQAMRLRRFSPTAIAAVLGESPHTIREDLKFLEGQNRSKYGAAPTLDPAQEIGAAIADFEEMEQVAWLEFHALKSEAQQKRISPMFVARARQGWIRTAAMMRVLRIKLLAEHGYLVHGTSTHTTTSVSRAGAIRNMLRAEGILGELAAAQDSASDPLPQVLDDTPLIEIEADQIYGWSDDGGAGWDD